MDWKFYDTHTEKDLQKRDFVTTVPIANQLCEIPVGTRVKVTRKGNRALQIKGERCPHCGVAIVCSGVKPSHLEEISQTVKNPADGG